MGDKYVFKGLTFITFSMFLFSSCFGLETTLYHLKTDDNLPIHRLYLFLTLIIFLFNLRQIINSLLSNKVLALLLVYVLITAIWASDPILTVKNFIVNSCIAIICTLVSLANIENLPQLYKRLFWLFLVIAILNLLVGTFMPEIGVVTANFPKPRWVGITFHPNILGSVSLIFIWLSGNLYYMAKGRLKKTVIFIAILIGFYIIYKADSFTSMGVSIAVLGLIFYYHYFSGLNLIIKLLLWTFLLLIFLISFSLFITPQEAIVSILEANGRNLTFTGRSLLWVKALYALPDHLLFGYGFDNLQALTERQYKQLINMAHLHNGYLEVLLKGGLIGFFLLMFNIVKTVYYQLKLRKNNKVVFIFLNTGLMMVLFHNFTESSLLKGSMTMDIVFIFIIVLTNLLNQKYQ